ncbi:MAG TPA: hypothetical protein VHL52_11815 [Acidimicrobiia bacterium]|nr:hypothetical protein [Acidimicrobiia bacterium]
MIIDLDTLKRGEGKRCELAKMGTITEEAARRILCDAELSRFITDGDSVILDMDRSTRTVTSEQLRALALRDAGCTYRGCDRPPEWCDSHHKRHWLDGGAHRPRQPLLAM